VPVDPHLQPVLDALAQMPVPERPPTVEEIRAGFAANPLFRSANPAPVGAIDTLSVPGPDGPVPVRAYRPEGAGPHPVVVFLHGGGWFVGNLDTHDGVCRELCHRTGALVLSVDYRLAPECRYPGPLDDCEAAWRWAAEHAGEIGGDPSRMALAGDSAGGNLAAALALRLRDRGPAPCLQVLVYPALDPTCSRPSMESNGSGYLLTLLTMRTAWGHYLGEAVDPSDPEAAPIEAADLSGLAPALVITAEYDPLRDEGEEYAERLEAAGVPCTCTRYDGMIHGFFQMLDVTPGAKAAHDEVAAALRAALA
jgi:acetyl esterase